MPAYKGAFSVSVAPPPAIRSTPAPLPDDWRRAPPPPAPLQLPEQPAIWPGLLHAVRSYLERRTSGAG